MKRTIILFLTILFTASSKTDILATTSVNITNEGDSKAEVNVQNSFNSSNTTTTTTNSSTKIRIETNGEVKEYESNNGEDVHIESSDGSSKVTVDNNDSKEPTSTLTPQPTVDDDFDTTEEAKKVTEKTLEELKQDQKNFFEKIESLIKEFFDNLF